MNIFVLDRRPIAAAHMMCDKHISKMVIECGQIMRAALGRHGLNEEMCYEFGILTVSGTPWRITHKNHPCTLWAGDSRANFMWLSLHAEALLNEYYDRYKKVHACHNAIYNMSMMRKMIPDGTLTPFAQAMPDEYRNPCAITAYRAYYHSKAFAKWEKGAPVPDWWRGAEVTA